MQGDMSAIFLLLSKKTNLDHFVQENLGQVDKRLVAIILITGKLLTNLGVRERALYGCFHSEEILMVLKVHR